MSSSELIIRAATPADAAFAVPLIQATIGPIGWALTGAASDPEAEAVMLEAFARPGHRLSSEQIRVAERHGQSLGLLLAYPGAQALALDDPWRGYLRSRGLPGHVESEGMPGELYLDTLAVHEAARNQGIGAALLAEAARWASELGLTRLGLLAQDGNPAARLYARTGFRPAGVRQLAGGRYTHLVRELAPPAPSV